MDFNAHHQMLLSARPNAFRVTFTRFKSYSSSTVIHARTIGEATEQAQQFLGAGETLTVEQAS